MDHSKRLRSDQTDAEGRIWSRLRNHQLGVKFRRQHRAEGFILDFACVERMLVVELDGGQHLERAEEDERRMRQLQEAGWRVVRFWNDDALLRTDAVIDAIWHELQKSPPHPGPLPRKRGRGSPRSSQGQVDSDQLRRSAPSPPLAGERAGVRGQTKPNTPQPSVLQITRASTFPVDESASTWQPTATLQTLHLRARLNAVFRAFFAARGVLEVETPILSRAGNTDPNIASFSLRFGGHVDAGPARRWLRTSPEFPLKRLLAAGVGDCYELGRVFRDGEAGGRHNPEFTMLEWYRVGWDHQRLIDECAALLEQALALVGRQVRLQRMAYRDLYRQRLQLDPMRASEEELRNALGDVRIDPEGLGRDDWLDLLMTHRLQPCFPPDELLAIHDYPSSQCALARLRESDGVMVAERFELYLGPLELANGYHELADADEQRTRFLRDGQVRAGRGAESPPLDEFLLSALAHGLPDCAGVALGVDRLLMAMLGTSRIADVLAFDFAHA